MTNLLVLGIGNLLMNDDAVGVLAVKHLHKMYEDSENFRILDGGTLGLDLLPHIEWSEKLIIIDAIDIGVSAGTVVRIEGEDIDPVFETKLSPHQMGIKDLLLTADLMGYRPGNIVLFGIQSKNIQMEMELSPEVENNFDKLLYEVEKEIKLSKIKSEQELI